VKVDKTLIVIKPASVKLGLVGRILSRFEQKGFKIINLKFLTLTKNQAELFYEPHSKKIFFQEIVEFMSSGAIICAILEAPGAVEIVRQMNGTTNSSEASPGTIRGDFGIGLTQNVIHASDSAESFQRESNIIFP